MIAEVKQFLRDRDKAIAHAAKPSQKGKIYQIHTPLEKLFSMTDETVDPAGAALAYSFARYLQNTPERLAKFARLCELIEITSQIPDPARVAEIYGFNSAAALEENWMRFIADDRAR